MSNSMEDKLANEPPPLIYDNDDIKHITGVDMDKVKKAMISAAEGEFVVTNVSAEVEDWCNPVTCGREHRCLISSSCDRGWICTECRGVRCYHRWHCDQCNANYCFECRPPGGKLRLFFEIDRPLPTGRSCRGNQLRRIDKSDGVKYTKMQFLNYYGNEEGCLRWEDATDIFERRPKLLYRFRDVGARRAVTAAYQHGGTFKPSWEHVFFNYSSK